MAKSSRKRPGPASATPPRTPASRPDASDGSGDDAAAYLETLVSGLNRLGVKPDGIIAILQAIKSAGAMQADLVVQ